MSDRRAEGKIPSANSLLDQFLSIPRPVYLGGFALGGALAALPLLAIHAVA
jgi:hypothetical protein